MLKADECSAGQVEGSRGVKSRPAHGSFAFSEKKNVSCSGFEKKMFLLSKLLSKKVEMVNFELGEELRKMFFRLVTSVGQRKRVFVAQW